MWPFKKRHPNPAAELTEESYTRWLRAQRPQPLGWFLNLQDLEQEALARMGDDYLEECAGLGAEAAAPESEADLLRKMVAAQTTQRPSHVPVSAAPLSMGGMKKRQEKRAETAQSAVDSGASFMGQKPDSANGEDA